MRSASWLIAAYFLATSAVIAALLGGHVGAAHALAFLPFGVLLVAIATGPRRRGWAIATTALACASLMTMSFASLTGDRIGQAGLAVGTILLAVALARAGAWAAITRHRLVTAGFLLIAGYYAVSSVIGIIIYAPQPVPRGCVDTCWGTGMALFVSWIYLAEVLLVTLVAIAFAQSWRTGLAALAVVTAENVMFFLAPPGSTVAYAIALPAWYLGLLMVARPWISPGRLGSVRPEGTTGGGGDADTQAERGGQGILQVADP